MDNLGKTLVVLTGAGISAESGLQTFRDANGLWENHRVESVASPEGFDRDPILVHQFYNQRRKQLKEVNPNAAHIALANLEAAWPGDFLLITQNVDDLHERAGSKKVLHMHGELKKALCKSCGGRNSWDGDLSAKDECPTCGHRGSLRPDIVWFGEVPYGMEKIMDALQACDIFISIGTSGRVYPAAGFVKMAKQAFRIELNLTSSDVSDDFADHRIGPASATVPNLVAELLM